MKKIGYLFIFCTGSLFAQHTNSLVLVPDSLVTVTHAGKRITYAYNTLSVEIFGQLLKVRSNKKLIITDEGTEDISSIKPHLFVVQDSAEYMFLMTDISFEVLSGFNLYLLKGNGSKPIGYFPVTAKLSGGETTEGLLNSGSLVNNLNIEIVGTDIRIYFTADSVILFPGTDREEVVRGDAVKFLYNGKRLKEVEEF